MILPNRNRRDRYDDDRVRQVGRPTDGPIRDDGDAESTLTHLWNQLEKSQKERDEMSKELGRLKVLTDGITHPPISPTPATGGVVNQRAVRGVLQHGRLLDD